MHALAVIHSIAHATVIGCLLKILLISGGSKYSVCMSFVRLTLLSGNSFETTKIN